MTTYTAKLFLTVACFIFGITCIPSELRAEPTTKVVTTTGMITDVVQNIGGERVQVTGLMGPGVDPHLYKATRSDIATLLRAEVVFYNGLLLEGKITDALRKVASAGRKVLAVTELIDRTYLLEPPEFQGHFDPHVWMDPSAWKKTIPFITKALSEHIPTSKELFEKNASAFTSELTELDQYAEQTLNTVPEGSRVLVTAHDAFNYFGRRYSFEVVGIQGISTESEAGVRDIERLVDLLVTRKIRAVFVESTVSQRNIEALIEGAASKGHKVVIGGELFSDAMGKPETYEGTYIGMIDHNVTTIARALGGDAPVRGFKGKLSISK